ncbi:arsenical efflux pump membrane protein ArsB [Deinococcus sonorensis]|uniref:Arsenical pump membrane protein n=2 Tax=Deinococcus sonorensis TaxID=309891 RepID=A0AAU7UAU8_9DEIO
MLALFLVLSTIALVIWQPRGLSPAAAACLGAVAALLTGTVHPADLLTVWHATWNATLTLVGLILLSLVLDAAGFFRWAALHVARIGGGRGVRLFVLLIVFSAVIAALFANDGAVLILTPLTLELAAALGYSRAATLAVALGVGFVVDAASVPLTVSNLVNIVTADAFHLGFVPYARLMVPVDVVVVLTCLLVLLLMYRRVIPKRYRLETLDRPASAIRSQGVFRLAWVLLPLLLLGYLLADPLHLPLSALVGAAALALVLTAARSQHLSSRALLRAAPWNVVVFSLAMYTVVYGLQNAGLTARYGELLARWSAHGDLVAVLLSGVGVAALSAGLNNLPALLFGLLGIQESGLSGHLQQAVVYGAVVGADIGPKLTPIGSLATLLWLHVLAGRGLQVSWGEYFRAGVRLTPPVLLAALLSLWVMLRLVG